MEYVVNAVMKTFGVQLLLQLKQTILDFLYQHFSKWDTHVFR